MDTFDSKEKDSMLSWFLVLFDSAGNGFDDAVVVEGHVVELMLGAPH